MRTDERPIAIVTVHGTGDTASAASGEKWFQRSSKFAGQLQQALAARGMSSEFVPHLWSGANSATARDKAARSLARVLRRISKDYSSVHVIGHSHGGNVASEAISRLNWSSKKRRRQKLASVTTVGTPFFRSLVNWGDRVGAWAFVAAATLSPFASAALIMLGLMLVSVMGVWSSSEPRPADQSNFLALLAGAPAGLLLIGLTPLVFMLVVGLQGVTKIQRAGRKMRAESEILAIRHPNDEAIAFLGQIESLDLEPFPKWSLFRSSRTRAVILAVQLVAVAATLSLLFALASIVVPGDLQFAGLELMIVVLAVSPVLFAAVYLLYRIAAAVLELCARGHLNRAVLRAVQGVAFGRDGDFRIGDVSPRSHYYGTRDLVLTGDIAERMNAASAGATQLLFTKYRTALFCADGGGGNAIGQLAQDAMTWDSLVHTTYFDQPEMAQHIADHIASKHHEIGNN